ncbi:MAG: hypothetical protein WAW75_04765, partial [Gallionella sp.]
PQVMATILMFAPFIVFAGSVKAIYDLLYPTITGILLNVVWFGIAWYSLVKAKSAVKNNQKQ